MGNKSDAELAKQLNYFTNILSIKRDRGGYPPPRKVISSSTGNEYRIDHKNNPHRLKPKIELTSLSQKYRLNVEARNMKELKKILNGYNRTYPQIDINKAISQSEEKFIKIENDLIASVSVGGTESNLSICKSAINFYLHKRYDKVYIQNLINKYIDEKASQYIEPIFLKRQLFSYEYDEVPHIISITGNSEDGELFCYIEYFGIYGFIVKMNDNYSGPSFIDNYYYDVLKKQEIKRRDESHIDITKIGDYIFQNTPEDLDLLKQRIARVIVIAKTINKKKYIIKVVDEVFEEIDKQIPNKEENLFEYNKRINDAIQKRFYDLVCDGII